MKTDSVHCPTMPATVAVQCPFGRDCGSVAAQEYPADHNGR